jgi:DNA-binding transcriptional MerR regulator
MPGKRSPYLISKEVASAIGVTQRTLEKWIKSGLVLAPAEDPNNGYRRWTSSHITEITRMMRQGELPKKQLHYLASRRAG